MPLAKSEPCVVAELGSRLYARPPMQAPNCVRPRNIHTVGDPSGLNKTKDNNYARKHRSECASSALLVKVHHNFDDGIQENKEEQDEAKHQQIQRPTIRPRCQIFVYQRESDPRYK
jgi:hypothetical protein